MTYETPSITDYGDLVDLTEDPTGVFHHHPYS
jgi:hypothetical protein